MISIWKEKNWRLQEAKGPQAENDKSWDLKPHRCILSISVLYFPSFPCPDEAGAMTFPVLLMNKLKHTKINDLLKVTQWVNGEAWQQGVSVLEECSGVADKTRRIVIKQAGKMHMLYPGWKFLPENGWRKTG